LAAGLVLVVLALGAGCSDDGGGASSARAPSGSPTTADPEPAPDGAAAGADDTVPGVPGEVADPVPIDAVTAFGDGVAVRLSSIEAVEAEASLPGEFSGPAVAVTVEVTNGSNDTIDLDHVIVDLATSAGASASPVTDPDREPLSGELAAGGTRTGAYVFTLDAEERTGVTVRVRYSADTPTVLFQGNVPDA
jgi:hypothetical protein